jgi:pimeloyl-ACP methyl ester carboxylesterase
MKPAVDAVERTGTVAGVDVRWLQAGDAPVLYLHGVPNSGDMWRPFLRRTGGIAPDLPGFGESSKRADFDYSIPGYDRFLETFVAEVGLERFSLVVHDWGAVGLALAQRFPDRIERLVISAAVPFVSDYRWHRVARMWRRPLVGELFMGFTTRWGARRALRDSAVKPDSVPDEFVAEVWRHFDQGTQRAILKLYRSAPEEVLARAGERLGDLKCPALVLWGTKDSYLPVEVARAYADALGGETELAEIEAGHWLWFDRPEEIDHVARFIAAP